MDADADLHKFVNIVFGRIPDDTTDAQYFELCKRFAQIVFKYIDPERLTQDEYFQVATIAVSDNGYAMSYVKADTLTPEQYSEVATLAVDDLIWNLRHVDPAEMRPSDYYTLVKRAVESEDGFLALYYVPPDALTRDEYFELAKIVIQGRDFDDLELLDTTKLREDQYVELVTLTN